LFSQPLPYLLRRQDYPDIRGFDQCLYPNAISHGLQAEQLVSGCVDQTRSSSSSSSSTASCWPPVDEVDTPGKSSDSG